MGIYFYRQYKKYINKPIYIKKGPTKWLLHIRLHIRLFIGLHPHRPPPSPSHHTDWASWMN